MITERRVIWLVTDQGRNNAFVQAYVDALVNEHFPAVVPTVCCVTVPRSNLRNRPGNVAAVQGAIHRRSRGTADHRDVVLLFRDSECRSEKDLRNEGMNLQDLVRGVASSRYPHVHGTVLNPMTEGAFLIFADALTRLPAAARHELHREIRERHAGRWISKDRVETALNLADGRRKRSLDAEMAAAVFGGGWPACEAVPFLQLTERIVGVCRNAGW